MTCLSSCLSSCLSLSVCLAVSFFYHFLFKLIQEAESMLISKGTDRSPDKRHLAMIHVILIEWRSLYDTRYTDWMEVTVWYTLYWLNGGHCIIHVILIEWRSLYDTRYTDWMEVTVWYTLYWLNWGHCIIHVILIEWRSLYTSLVSFIRLPLAIIFMYTDMFILTMCVPYGYGQELDPSVKCVRHIYTVDFREAGRSVWMRRSKITFCHPQMISYPPKGPIVSGGKTVKQSQAASRDTLLRVVFNITN